MFNFMKVPFKFKSTVNISFGHCSEFERFFMFPFHIDTWMWIFAMKSCDYQKPIHEFTDQLNVLYSSLDRFQNNSMCVLAVVNKNHFQSNLMTWHHIFISDCLEPDWYLCKDNKTCISHNTRCDGHFDCPTDDDEDNCDHYVSHHEVTECSRDEFKCTSDGVCLPLELVCDGTKQCFDGSDEVLGCKILEKSCKGFICNNGHCLTDKAWLCDG